jgi:hypothetical protein
VVERYHAEVKRDTVAICINHGAIESNVGPEQFDALIETICYIFDKLDWGYDEYGVRERLFFHRDFNPGKTCPGMLDKEAVIMHVVKKLAAWGDQA